MIQVRPASVQDLDTILEIYNHAVLHTNSVYTEIPNNLEQQAQWLQEKEAADLPVFVAIKEGRLAGYASYSVYRPWSGFRYCREVSVYVHPECRRQGIARALYEQIIEYARQKGIHVLVAGIDAENSSSIYLHEQFGFEQVGHLKEVGFKFGKWLDLIFMQLKLG
jgi:L-amino acid N-acyltransferase YncA